MQLEAALMILGLYTAYEQKMKTAYIDNAGKCLPWGKVS